MPKKPPLTSNGKGARCIWCDRELEATTSRSRLSATRDHVHPKSKGGSRREWCCWACNNLKKDMTAADWQLYREANPEWWRLAPKKQSRPGRYVTGRGYVYYDEDL